MINVICLVGILKWSVFSIEMPFQSLKVWTGANSFIRWLFYHAQWLFFKLWPSPSDAAYWSHRLLSTATLFVLRLLCLWFLLVHWITYCLKIVCTGQNIFLLKANFVHFSSFVEVLLSPDFSKEGLKSSCCCLEIFFDYRENFHFNIFMT